MTKIYGINVVVDRQPAGSSDYEPYDFTETKEFKSYALEIKKVSSTRWQSTRELKMKFYRENPDAKIHWFQDALDYLVRYGHLEKLDAYITKYKLKNSAY